jgi:hypothetical protein
MDSKGCWPKKSVEKLVPDLWTQKWKFTIEGSV